MKHVNLGLAISYPRSDRAWLTKLGIGVFSVVGMGYLLAQGARAVLSAAVWARMDVAALGALALTLIVPILFAASWLMGGYGVRTIRHVSEGNGQGLPQWGGGLDLLLKGFGTTLVLLGYLAIPAVLLGLALRTALASLLFGGGGSGVAGLTSLGFTLFGAGIGALIGLVGLVAGLAAVAFLPMAYLRFATTGDIRAAFRLKEIKDALKACPGDYLMIVVFTYLLHLGTSFLIGFIPVSFVASVVGLFIAFYINLMLAHMLAQYHLIHLRDRV